ncbi:2Fe-2S iron-sulfur cluster binding domain protein [Paraburkholderia xenovorans LB400]|uniref:Ferredoxin-containing oxidoreductase n=1 Tax=Paraburkholderia xenovorans (strain LB400) TaxID=266265 RepID=Q13GV4_PARXL|nr:PDR/VanB family oxidoreductase [Paraburkholderia xenovorans]ABE36685.1 Putative ferredoxin-containing oxidoreductase [Paraburkholderia xenovorans LB400]AIP34512.1 2Fe-2S iron-sulfur cluster binding domain protein [Paraburkholderia xenovorans LB400]
MNPLIAVRVARKRIEAADIASLILESADGAPLPPAGPGAHIDVHTPSGCVRQYSLCNLADEHGHYRIAVLRDSASRGGSISMHDDVLEGGKLSISAPKNHFPLREDARHSILIAGGIGITPVIAMASALHARGASFALHYRTRSAARTAFLRELTHGALAPHCALYHDDAPALRKLELMPLLEAAPPDTHVYVCGPKGFMDAVISTARAQHWSEDRIHFEYFAGVATPGANANSFEVVLAKSGQVVQVAPSQTIVEVCSAHGVAIPTSCLHGICGTCITRVLEGEVEHKDFYLTPQERASHTQMLPCCSRAKSHRLVLDL